MKLMKTIPINRSEEFVIVDDDVFLVFEGRKMHRIGKGYVGSFKDGKLDYVHREILGLKPFDGMEADHINRNKLDNRRCNLRVATRSQNCANTSIGSRNKTGVRGVWFCNEKKKFRVQIQNLGRRISLGSFITLREANEARIKAEAELLGEFAPR